MATTLAALTRNAKRKEHNMNAAIKDWEHDLGWLKKISMNNTALNGIGRVLPPKPLLSLSEW